MNKKITFLFFALFFGLISFGQVRPIEYPSGYLSEEKISSIIQRMKGEGASAIELQKTNEILYRRLKEQNAAISNGTFANKQPVGPPQVMAGCTNIGFENGTTSGWNFQSGNASGATLPCQSCITTSGGVISQIVTGGTSSSVNSQGTCGLPGNQEPCTGGIDNYGGFPCLAPAPLGGTYSLLLNNTCCYYKMAQVQQAFVVNASNQTFTFQYAVVLQDGNHTLSASPYFEVDVTDLNTGQVVPCTQYTVSGTASGSLTGFTASSVDPTVYYKPWTTVTLDLTAATGHTVNVEFTVSDCNASGHFGYAYIDASCNPNQITLTNGLCQGGAPAVVSGPPGMASYTWSPTSPTVNTQTLSTNVAANYTLNMTTPTGCAAPPLYYNLTLNPLPVPNFSTSSVACSSTENFTDMSTVSSGSVINWYWDFGDGSAPVSSGTANQTHTYPSSGQYTVTLIDSTAAGCKATHTMVVNAGGGGVVTNLTNNGPKCFGAGAINFTNGTTSSGSLTISGFNWDFGDGQTATTTTASPNATHSYTASGIYVVTVTANISGCSPTITTTVTIYDQPTLTVAAVSGCLGLGTIYSATAAPTPTTGYNYSWDFGDGTGGTGSAPTHTYAAAGSFPVSATVTTANNCSVVATTTTAVSPPPSLTVAPSMSVCPNSALVIPNYTTNPANIVSVDWVNTNTVTGIPGSGNGNISPCTTPPNLTGNNLSGVITYTPSVGSCIGSPVSHTITIYPTPVMTPIANINTCNGYSVAAFPFNSNPAGTTTYTLTTNIGTSMVTPLFPSFTANNPGAVTQSAIFSVTPGLNGCPGLPATFTITVYPTPQPKFSYSKTCDGYPVTLTDATVYESGIKTWSWSAAGNNLGSGQTAQTVLTPAGYYTVTLAVTGNTTPSCSNSVSQPVYINPLPTVVFSGVHLTSCPQDTAQFSQASVMSDGTGIKSWTWNFGNGDSVTYVKPQVPTIDTVYYDNLSHTQNALYSIKLTVVSDSGCVNTLLKPNYVTVYPHPLADFSWGPTDADIDDPTIHFINDSKGAVGPNATGPAGIKYYLGDIFAVNPLSNTTTVANPSHVYEYEQPYTYYVTQWVENMHQCKDSITKPVDIKPSFTFYIPNAFSPTGDGKNDGFKGTGIGIDNKTYNMWVYDRWGNMLFHSDDIENAWNGCIHNNVAKNIVQQDVYVWKVTFEDFRHKKHQYTGTVTLLR